MDEVPAYKHGGNGTRSAGIVDLAVQAEREKELKVAFSTLMTSSPNKRTASVMGGARHQLRVGHELGQSAVRSGGMHPMLVPDDPACRAF